MARIDIPRNQQKLLSWGKAIKRKAAKIGNACILSDEVLAMIDSLIIECEAQIQARNDLRNEAQAATEDTALAFGTHPSQSVNTEGSLVFAIHKAILEIKAAKPGKEMEFRKYGIEAKHTKSNPNDLDVDFNDDDEEDKDDDIGIDEEGVS